MLNQHAQMENYASNERIVIQTSEYIDNKPGDKVRCLPEKTMF